MRRFLLLISTISTAIGIGVVSSALAALPPGVAGIVTPQQRAVVIGRDMQVTVNVELPDSCAGTSVELRLYQAPTDGSNVLQPATPPEFSRIAVNQSAAKGRFAVVLLLPTSLAGDPVRLWPGVSGSCLAAPLYDSGLGIDFAKVDATENPGNTSTIVVSGAALKLTSPTDPSHTTLGQFTGSITIMADGVACATAKLGGGATTDAAGNVRIHLGTAGQPTQCSTAGAAITFVRADGAILYEKRTVLPGVTQLLQNLAREAIVTGQTPTPAVTPTTTVAPGPPNTGDGGLSADPGSGEWLMAMGAAALLAALVSGGVFALRRQQ